MLCDERSRQVLRGVLTAMLTGDKAACADVFEGGQYFCLPRFCGQDNESYVDAGAFVGDSIERFIWANNGVFSKIYGFEPGPRQFAALQARVGRLRTEWALDAPSIELINAGLGETQGSAVAASASGQLPSLALQQADGNAGTTEIVRLDDFIGERRITFLKADVEGMEMPLLRGAQSTIRRCRPKLAICAYHYPSDIPDIVDYLSGIEPQYQFALRHHTPQLMETVLYCWVD